MAKRSPAMAGYVCEAFTIPKTQFEKTQDLLIFSIIF